ncbi:MAG: ABC transporter permease [Actinomycetes bacterium]|jgi:putative ABC transport system permease protein|nr:ABC transporter permease [Actinomycetes bacterium]
MNLVESFKIALKGLAANKARAALTMLGVIIGVSSVILLISIGSGVTNEVTGQLEGLGSNLIYVMPGNYEELMNGNMAAMSGAMMGQQFTVHDVDAVETQLSDKAWVTPYIENSARVSVNTNTNEIVSGIEALGGNVTQVMDIKLSAGRAWTQSEVTGAARVAVIGDGVREQLLPGRDPIGAEIKLNGQRFRVIGLREKVGGGAMGGSQDSSVAIPYTTAQNLLSSSSINAIMVKAKNPDDMHFIQTRIRQILRPAFGADFSVFSQDQLLGIMGTMMNILTYMLGGIASISLLVGGIGIMNIMLVSVSERTREIGIRKAIGARTWDILAQFVIESILLSVLGGIIGITIGALGAWALSSVLPTTVTLWAVALAFFFSVSVGVFFGVYPAHKASQLDPIEALRHE